MFYSVDADALHSTYVIQVTPDAKFGDLHTQLVSPEKSDKVHPVGGMSGLLTYRLGGERTSKRCFALIEERNRRRDIVAAIYTHWSCQPETDESWKMLPGRIDEILKETPHPLESDPTVVTFYSISSFAPGAGKKLIGTLHKAFTGASNPPILTTLSPLRTFSAWLDQTGQMIEGSIDDMLATVAEYLGLKEDPVEKFHLGNGAQIGAIHFNASASGPDAEDGAGCMISYRYPRRPERLQGNRDAYKSGEIPVSDHLRPLF